MELVKKLHWDIEQHSPTAQTGGYVTFYWL